MSRQRQQPSAAALTAAALNHLSGTPPLPLGHPGQHQPPPPSEDDNSMETGAGGAGGAGTNTATGTNMVTGENNGPGYYPYISGVSKQFQLMQLNPKDLVCEFLDESMIAKKGIILQYINSNSSGATTMIGVTRIGLTDQRKMPAYVARNVSIIRQHAVAVLQRHLRLTQCATGVLEQLCPDDFSISFSWASLTPAGRSLTQYGKPDLGLGFAMCEGYVAPMMASASDPEPVCVLNVYIQLQEPSRRSSAVLKRAKEDDAMKASPPKKQYNGSNGYSRNPPNSDEKLLEKFAQRTTALVSEAMKRSAPEMSYPPLPQIPPPEWNKTGVSGLPHD